MGCLTGKKTNIFSIFKDMCFEVLIWVEFHKIEGAKLNDLRRFFNYV